jgi:predicted RNA-binding Zn ribbon-like protein
MVSEPDRLPTYQRLVDGLVLPIPIAGEVVLDFCNTRAGWGEADPREYLTSYDHLAAWAGASGLVDAEVAARVRRAARLEPAEANRVLKRAVALREAVYAACTDPAAADAWDVVAAEARAAAAAAVLAPEASPGRRWVVPESAGLDLPALELGRAAGAFLGSADLGVVRRCPGSGCGWLFLDPRGRRRWCTMAVCGNRAKVRRHAARTRERRRT